MHNRGIKNPSQQLLRRTKLRLGSAKQEGGGGADSRLARSLQTGKHARGVFVSLRIWTFISEKLGFKGIFRPRIYLEGDKRGIEPKT